MTEHCGMVMERKPVKVDRQKRLTRGNSHYEFLLSGFQLKESTAFRQNNAHPPVPVRSFIVPERICHKVEFKNIRNPVLHSARMSVEESLQYLDNTLAELDKVSHDHHLYESESDMLSEFGYASGYTELSVTSDSENHPRPVGVSSRRRKSRQNRNQRYQSDPILGDMESDSTNDGCLFGNGITPKMKTKTNSGQRRQRERRRQRRQNANRNSWTDSGLSLSKTDSQRSSHGENSPVKRGRSKTSPADLDLDAREFEKSEGKTADHRDIDDKATSPIQMDSGIYSPNMETDCSNMERDSVSLSNMTLKGDESESNNNNNNNIVDDVFIESDKENKKETVFVLSSSKTQNFASEEQSLKSLSSTSSSLDHSFINIKPTNANGVVNGTYSPKEKEILQQVFQNARNSCSSMRPDEHSSATRESLRSPASGFPLPPHLDYPFCMYRNDAKPKKNKKPGGFIRGFKRLKEGISNKQRSFIMGDEAKLTNAREFHNQTPLGCENQQRQTALPPSKSVDKKKGLLRRIFKTQNNQNSKPKSQNPAKKAQNFNRDRFGSSRSFSSSISQLWSRGNRARTQSMENLKNVFRREKGTPFIKRSVSSTSLAAKLPRSLSLTSLISRRGKPFTRHGSVVSVAASCSRQQNNNYAFRRADSVRSLQGGYDIATRLLQSQNACKEKQFSEQYYEDSNDNYMPPYGQEMNVPFRGGWRPSSRISRRDPYLYEQQYYEEDFDPYDNCYEDEGPCTCGCEEQYTDNGCYYDDYEHFIGHSYGKQDCYNSPNAINQQYFENNPRMIPSRQSFSRQSSQQMMTSTYAPSPNLSSSYYSPRSYRAEHRMVVAPLNVQVTQERRAERRQLSRASEVFDTMV